MPFGWHTFFAYAAKLAGVKNVAVHVGSYPYFQRGLNAWKAFLEVKSGNFVTDSFIACSDYVREGLVKNFDISASRVAKIYNGCRAQAICEQAQRSRQARENSRLTMGMVASFENAKDHVTLIEAARMLKDRNADFELWLIGDGSQKEKCRQLAAGYGLEDNIKFLGVRRDIPEILGKMDIFVYSVNREEGLGVAMIEAMAAGVPIIASSVEACTELLENGKLGTLFIPGEPDSLTEAIIYAVNNMALVKSKAKMAADKIFQEFTIEKMAGLYASCLGFHDDNR
jgi:glycosyltransferase involved in cell wall biosynthesis